MVVEDVPITSVQMDAPSVLIIVAPTNVRFVTQMMDTLSQQPFAVKVEMTSSLMAVVGVEVAGIYLKDVIVV
jgi:Tfp pilus assembly protein PilN